MTTGKNVAPLLCMIFVLIATPVFSQEPYIIGAGDVLEISVWKNQDLTRQVIVLPDDTIRFPLIGELKVGGQSLAWLDKTLKMKLEKFIPDPDLSVALTRINSMFIYVIGKVNKPGQFPITDNVDVLQALAVAGGLNPFAKEKEIKIFRKQGKDTLIFKFNYDAVSKGENLEQNITLNRNDIIVVR